MLRATLMKTHKLWDLRNGGEVEIEPGEYDFKEDTHPTWPSRDAVLILQDPSVIGKPPDAKIGRTQAHVDQYMKPQGIMRIEELAPLSNP